MLTIVKKRSLLNLTAKSLALCNPRLFSSQNTSEENDRNTIYSILNPFIDFDERIKSPKLENSLIKRNLKINLDSLKELWDQYKTIEKAKLKLEQTKTEIADKIKAYADSGNHSTEISGLKTAGKVIRQDIKNISSTLSDLEQKLLFKVIRLPNDVREDLFPEETVSYLYPVFCDIHHLELGKKFDLVEYISPVAYFLKHEAASFELDVTSKFLNLFCNNGFIATSNPDFSRSLVLEGTCLSKDIIFKLEKERRHDDLYLNGSASLFPFCSYHAKHIASNVPIKYVCQGRHYHMNKYHDGLYTVFQSNAVQIFVGSSESGILDEFKNVIKILVGFYQKLGLHFQIKRIPAPELELPEAIRLSFQVYSPFKNEFFEVGNLSFYTDYLSKRLRMYYKDGSENQFMQVISGTIVKIPPLIASYLEHNNSCYLPDNL